MIMTIMKIAFKFFGHLQSEKFQESPDFFFFSLNILILEALKTKKIDIAFL